MPFVQQHLVAEGTTFLRGYATTSLCCPSRSSLLTGQYARHTRVIDNGGWRFLDDRQTVATWLDAVGYRTALIGKYLNGYGDSTTPAGYIPPGWDSWHAMWNANSTTSYQQYALLERDPGTTAVLRSFDTRNSTSQLACADGNQYATDLLCRRAVDFLAADSTDPFFLLLATSSPHLPAPPPTRWSNRYGSLVLPSYPNENAVPSPRPPRWLPTSPLTANTLNLYRNEYRRILATNRAADDAVDALVAQLRADGRLDETVFFFMSDNGFARGEHRYGDKGCEYEECHRVPFVVVCPDPVCPGATPATVDSEHLALNIDVAPTLAELAGAAPGIRMDGRSLVPVLTQADPDWRSSFLLEDHGITQLQSPLAITGYGSDGHLYKYGTFRRNTDLELYDLTTDPWELVNLVDDGVHTGIQATLAARLADAFNAPTVGITSGPSGVVPTSDVTFTFSASQASSFECSLDSTTVFLPCGEGTSGVVSYSRLSLTAHSFRVRAVDADNNVSQLAQRNFTASRDTSPPPAPVLTSTPPDPSGREASFSFSEEEPGVALSCSLDGGTAVPCTSPTTYTGLSLGAHTFSVVAKDAAGNVSPSVVFSWQVVDSDAPAPPLLTEAPDDPSPPDVVFAFRHDELDVTFECSVDGSEPSPCTSPHDIIDLPDGAHTFDVFAADQSGNRSAAATFSWTVDDSPTAPRIMAAPQSPAGPSVSIEFEGAPETSQECSLDGAPFTACSSPIVYEDLADGAHAFRVRSVDGVDVSGTARVTWVVDATRPTPPAFTQQPSDPSAPEVTFAFSASDPDASFLCALDGAPIAVCTSPTSMTLGGGDHVFVVWAVDGAGNLSDPASSSWTVDDVPPPAPTIIEAPGNSSVATATFRFEDAEPGATFRCALDASPFASCSSPRTYEGLTGGTHTFMVLARDAVGNQSPAASHTWSVDASPPVVTVTWPPTVDAFRERATVGMQWTGRDDVGIVRYDVYERSGTTGAQVFVQSMLTTTYTKNVARGTTYCYQVRAFDAAGNMGVGQERCSGVPFDDADPQIVPTGDVARIGSANAFTGTLSVLDGAGEQLSYSFTGRKVGIVTRRDASSGMADIFLDGAFMTRVDLYSATARDKVLAWERVVSDGPHTVTIVWTGARNAAASGTSLSVDGIGSIGPAL
jgi:arylsulfatase A-like enzyme